MGKRRQRILIPYEKEKNGPSWILIILMFCSGGMVPIGIILLVRKLVLMSRGERRKRMMKIANSMDDRDFIPIRDIAMRVGRPKDEVMADVQRMIDNGYLPGGSYIDHRGDVLVFGDAEGTYQPGTVNVESFEDIADMVGNMVGNVVGNVVNGVRSGLDNAQGNYRNRQRGGQRQYTRPEPEREAPQAKPQPAPETVKSDNYDEILREIRRLNDQIADPEVSRRIDRIGELSASIFSVVRQHPDRESDVRKFMSYYLPTTEKLLKSYSLMEKQSYQGTNITQSRQKIEDILDTLIRAFEQMQDELFRTDAMDVDAEISVLETMLKKDGFVQPGGVDLHKAAGGH